MAVNVQTAYSGEVLQNLLVKATTENELVNRGLIRLEPNVSDKVYLPRMKTGSMLQKRKEQPEDGDSKGDFNYDERALEPQEFMAFTTFNPRSFENIWKQWQPTGELVFRELPKSVQNTLLSELAKVVNFELGDLFINGVHGSGDKQLFNGILTRIIADKDVIRVTAQCGTMKEKLRAIYAKIPKEVRKSPGLKILMSVEDFDKYDDELSDQSNKGADVTTTNPRRFKNIPIEDLSAWPEGVIVATICGMDLSTNLWAGVSMVNDFSAVKIDRLTNAGEKYFFKMLMKADTAIAFGEEVVLYDERGVLSITPETLEFAAAGETKTVTVTSCCGYTLSGKAAGFTATKNGDTVSIVAAANTATEVRGGKFVLTASDGSKTKVEIAVNQLGATA